MQIALTGGEFTLHCLNEGMTNRNRKKELSSSDDFLYDTSESLCYTKTLYNKVKRIIDIILSAVIATMLSPLFIIVAIAIKIDSKGPILFKQQRIGKNGKTFVIYKYRTMCVDAESIGTRQYSFINDSRVTKVGKILRATSIDELPQIINIIKGEMSFIGPRPTLTYHPWTIDEYTQEQLLRFAVLPGITGLAQINGRKVADWNERIEYDIRYVKNLSFMLDLKICFSTIWKLISMKDNQSVKKTVKEMEVNQDVEAYIYNK